MKKITDFKAGETARLHHKITPADIQSFVDLTGDDNPLHTDAAWAESSSMRGIVSHGMLSASFISTIIGKKLPGPGALWLSQSIDFLLPVRVNDTLTVEATVVEVHTRQRSLDLACSITNQDGKEVLRGTCAVKLLDEPEAEKTSPRTASRGDHRDRGVARDRGGDRQSIGGCRLCCNRELSIQRGCCETSLRRHH